MVDALHEAGIEVWLDVVYNHTAEGDHSRADLHLARDRQQHVLHRRPGRLATDNDTGCGNTTAGRATSPSAR